MINDILIVDSVQEAISWFGIEQFRDMVLQEQGGNYFFVDIDLGCPVVKALDEKREKCEACKVCLPTEQDCLINGEAKCGGCWNI